MALVYSTPTNRTWQSFFGGAGGGQLYSQSFVLNAPIKVTSISFTLSRSDPPDSVTPYGSVKAFIFSTYTGTPGVDAYPTGSAFATSNSIAINAGTIPSSYGEVVFPFSGGEAKNMAAGTYMIVIDGSNVNLGTSGNGGNGIFAGLTSGDPGNGALYEAGSWSPTGDDLMFTISGDPLGPGANFTASPTTGTGSLTVNFTDTSTGSPTAWNWSFGDGGTITLQNPTWNYTPGRYTVSLTASNVFGSSTSTQTNLISVVRPISPTAIAPTTTLGSPAVVQLPPPPPQPTDWSAIGKEDEKVYVYKVYKADGTYIGIWSDVKDQPQFTQRLNTPGTTMTVQLGRSPNTMKEMRTRRSTHNGDRRVTNDGTYRSVKFATNNSVGEDTDLDVNYRVDVYVHYGEFNQRVTHAGDVRVTADGNRRVVASGAPLGVRIFSGYVMDYESVYGRNASVTVTLASNGFELSQEIIRNGDNIGVSYPTTAIDGIVKSILDTNPGRMSYNASTIDSVGTSITAAFKLNTKLEGIESAVEQAPDGWYWFGDVGENAVYLKQRSATFDHIFIMGYTIKELRVVRSIENLVNDVWFVGGEVSGVTKFKRYQDSASQTAWRRGVERITDRRYKLDASMANRANKLIGRFKAPIFTSPITISSGRYPIEDIKLGQTVGFVNVGNFIDDLPPLQIVSKSYSSTEVTLQLGELLDRQVDVVTDIEDDLATEQYDTIPNTPS